MNGRFNRTAIKAWQQDLTRIPRELSALNASILQDEAASKAVQERIENEARVFIRPIDENIDALQSQIGILENNQNIKLNEQIKISQQEIIDANTPQLLTTSSALSAKINEVAAIQHLQQIKNAQDILQTHPPLVSALSLSVVSLGASMRSESNQASNLGYRISTLQGEVSALEQEEALDRQRHAIANAHAYEYHHHHDRHHDHHGHHHHDDHHPNLFVSLLGAATSIGEFAADVGRSNRLASKRRDLRQAMSDQSSHQYSANRLSEQYNSKNQELARYEHDLKQQQAWLVSIDFTQQDLARRSTSSQLAYDLSQRSGEQRELERKQSELSRTVEQANEAYRTAQNTINTLEKQNARLVRDVRDQGSNNDRDNLNQQLLQAKASRVPYDVIEKNYLAEDARYLANIVKSRRQIQSLTSLESRQLGNHFLINLRENPKGLISNFVTQYTNIVTVFDAAHPADQSHAEQKALVEMRNDVAYIQVLANQGSAHVDTGEGQPHEHKQEDDGLPHHPDRLRLYQLCGLLLVKAAAIESSEESAHSPLADQLKSLTNQFPLDQTETVAEYHKLARPLVTPEYMTQIAVNAYDRALADLRATAGNTRTDVKELRTLSETARALSNSIDSNKSNVKFNILFYTKMLTAANALLLRPSSTKLQRDFEELVKLDKLGLANNCKRGTGVAFLFLGAATLATSVLADYGYIPIPDAVPPAARKAAYGVGGAGVAYGLWSLFRGREQGSVKASHKFSEAASHVPSTLLVLKNQQLPAVSAASSAPKTLFASPRVDIVVQSVQANDSGYSASKNSNQDSNMQAPLLNVHFDPSAPPPEYSEVSNNGILYSNKN